MYSLSRLYSEWNVFVRPNLIPPAHRLKASSYRGTAHRLSPGAFNNISGEPLLDLWVTAANQSWVTAQMTSDYNLSYISDSDNHQRNRGLLNLTERQTRCSEAQRSVFLTEKNSSLCRGWLFTNIRLSSHDFPLFSISSSLTRLSDLSGVFTVRPSRLQTGFVSYIHTRERGQAFYSGLLSVETEKHMQHWQYCVTHTHTHTHTHNTHHTHTHTHRHTDRQTHTH